MGLFKKKQRKQFKTSWYHRKMPYWFSRNDPRPDGDNPVPPMIRLDPRPGMTPSSKPPVRIFLGTEPLQYRAERIFVFSVEKVRDPSRAYEIHFMSDIRGIDRTTWKTGFTMYRFCIPEWCDFKGRAIYNDVDQIYLADPAELFDMDMKGRAVASISVQDNSVMLMDCEKLKGLWSIGQVRNGDRPRTFKEPLGTKDLWIEMSGVWNARDGEFPISESKCIHYTTLQTQPWQPFPHVLNYSESPTGQIWHDLEKEADAAHYMAFTKAHPSPRFAPLLEQHRLMHVQNEDTDAATQGKKVVFKGWRMPASEKMIGDLARKTSAKTILDFGSGRGGFYKPFPGEADTSRFKSNPNWPDVKIICFDPGYEPFAQPWDQPTDGVISTDVVEHLSPADIPWLLDEIFSGAQKFVYVAAACYPAKKLLPNGQNAHSTVQQPEWWRNEMRKIASKYPQILWVLACDERPGTKERVRTHFSSDPAFVSGPERLVQIKKDHS